MKYHLAHKPPFLSFWRSEHAVVLDAIEFPDERLRAPLDLNKWSSMCIAMLDELAVMLQAVQRRNDHILYNGPTMTGFAVALLIQHFDANVLASHEHFLWLLCRMPTVQSALEKVSTMLSAVPAERHATVCRLLKYLANLEPFDSVRNELMRHLTTFYLVPELGEPTEAIDWCARLKNDAMVDWFAERTSSFVCAVALIV